MTYTENCTGTPVIDQSSTLEVAEDFIPLGINTAYAQKFTPTSKCLQGVVLKLKNVLDGDVTVRICNDINGFPNFPGSNLGEFTEISSEIPSTLFREIEFPLNILLDNLNPLWIVITSNYDPNTIENTELVDMAGKFEDSNGMFASKVKNGGWTHISGKPYFKTFKQTQETPAEWDLVITEESDSFIFKSCSSSEGGYFHVLTPSNKEIGKVDIPRNDCRTDNVNKSFFTESGTYKAQVVDYNNVVKIEKTFNVIPKQSGNNTTLLLVGIGVLGLAYLLTRKKE